MFVGDYDRNCKPVDAKAIKRGLGTVKADVEVIKWVDSSVGRSKR
jgi:hypothetical protein